MTAAPYAPPPLLFRGRWWSTRELSAMAATWWMALAGRASAASDPWAMPMASHPEAVALFFALSCLSVPVILLPASLRGWRSVPHLPPDARLAVPPALRKLAGDARRLGLSVIELPDPDASTPAGDPPFMTAPGFVFFTSGSTGLPRPVYRTTSQLIEGGLAPVRAVGVPARGGVIGSLPLDRTFGMHHGLMVATVLQRPLALLERFQHHAVLDLFACGEYHYWAGTPVMADVLGRCTLPASTRAPHPAPPVCVISGRLSAAVCRTFRERFGVPLRQVYGTTETGAVTMETAPADRVRSESAGRALPGIRLCIGDTPLAPVPHGEPGRVWVSGPGCASGYGFPPDVVPLPGVAGWWQSPDIGSLDAEDGYLTILGRADDCVRTGAGHVVSPAAVADALEAYPEIVEAVVVPVGPPADPLLGALVESAQPLLMSSVRRHLARSLPPWSQPRLLGQVRTLPRLPSGKPDRLACIALLARSPRCADE